MALSMTENTIKAKCMDMAFTTGMMIPYTKATGKTISSMEKVSINGLMAADMLAPGKTT